MMTDIFILIITLCVRARMHTGKQVHTSCPQRASDPLEQKLQMVKPPDEVDDDLTLVL